MPRKRKDSFEESIEECVKEMKTAVEEVGNAAGSAADPQDEIERKREELIKLAEDGQIDRNVKAIKKASNKVIERYYNEYERKRMQKANEFLTDQLISKFADTLGGLDAIESPDVLSDELRKDDLLKNYVRNVVERISPYIPFLGFLSGGTTTAKHVYEHESKPKCEQSDERNNPDNETSDNL